MQAIWRWIKSFFLQKDTQLRNFLSRHCLITARFGSPSTKKMESGYKLEIINKLKKRNQALINYIEERDNVELKHKNIDEYVFEEGNNDA